MKSTSALLFGYNGNDPSQTLNLAETDPLLVRSALEQLDFWIPDEAVATGPKATLAQLEKTAGIIFQESPIGVIFFFSGHGTLASGRNLIEFADGVHTLEKVKHIILNRIPNLRRLVMIVDACRVLLGAQKPGSRFLHNVLSGSEDALLGIWNAEAPPPAGNSSNPPTAYMFSCKWGESSLERPGDSHGIFTGALAQEIRRADRSDPLLLTALADRLKMDGGQQALVIDGYGLALRNLGDIPATPPDAIFDSAIDQIECFDPRALCLTLDGELAISESGRGWAFVGGAPFRSAGIAGSLFFAHSEKRLITRVGRDKPKSKPLEGEEQQFVHSPGGKWLAAIPIPEINVKPALYLGADCTESAFEIPVNGVRQLALVDEDANRILMVNASGQILLHDRHDGTTLSLMGTKRCICPARLANSADENWAAWSDWQGKLWIWSHVGETVEETVTLPAPATALTIGTTGLIAAGLADGTVVLRDSCRVGEPFKVIPNFRAKGIVTAVGFAVKESYLMVGTSRRTFHSIRITADLSMRAAT